VPRGLYGALIVEEDKPPKVDRDEVWLLSDIKLDEQRQQVEDYGRILDVANDGRRGNQLLVNGLVAGPDRRIDVRSGERLRLRLINAASARFFRVVLEGHAASIVAWDGQGVTPHAAPADGIVLGPGMRVDLIIDCMQKPGTRFEIREAGRPKLATMVLGVIAYSAQAPLRSAPLATSIVVPPNALPEPNLDKASDHYIMFQGGMRGAPTIGLIDGKPSQMAQVAEIGIEKYQITRELGHGARRALSPTLPTTRSTIARWRSRSSSPRSCPTPNTATPTAS
jgi:FtsP/CotA-like multicopper oxidase with cupredoxin domain